MSFYKRNTSNKSHLFLKTRLLSCQVFQIETIIKAGIRTIGKLESFLLTFLFSDKFYYFLISIKNSEIILLKYCLKNDLWNIPPGKFQLFSDSMLSKVIKLNHLLFRSWSLFYFYFSRRGLDPYRWFKKKFFSFFLDASKKSNNKLLINEVRLLCLCQRTVVKLAIVQLRHSRFKNL